MGRLVLISGENDSGKSLFAEQWIAAHTADCTGGRYYIATMLPCTEDNHRRIAKHRLQRQGLGFVTLEEGLQVGQLPVEADSVVLLEDVSNLLSNVIFGWGGSAAQVYQELCQLLQRCDILVAVTISGLRSQDYDGETSAYIDELNWLNSQLLQLAALAVHMEQQRPIIEKGAWHETT